MVVEPQRRSRPARELEPKLAVSHSERPSGYILVPTEHQGHIAENLLFDAKNAICGVINP